MNRVKTGPIKEFAVGIYDGPHATPPDASEGPIFLGIKNVTPDGRLDFSEVKYVSERDFPRWTKRVTPQKDDIVFSYEATLHRYALVPEGFRGCLGRRMALIRPDTSKLRSRYLHYYLLGSSWRAVIEANIISGATVDRIPIATFPTFPVTVPSLGVQDSVINILSAYDDLIENNRRRIQLLEQAAHMLYKEWFVWLRFPGHEHAKSITGVPEGWARKKLGQLATLRYGKALKEEDRAPGPYPVYGSSGVIGEHEKPLVSGPGIIVGRKGNVGSVYWSGVDFFPIDTVYYIDSTDSSLYLYYALRQLPFISTDVAVPGLNRDFAHSREILVPDGALRLVFEETVAPIHRQISMLRRFSKAVADARDLLLPRLMNGTIKI